MGDDEDEFAVRLPADAEDAVQETFIAFVKSLQNYRGECALETYLFALL
ncbi:hypothetical protein GH157_02160, partial [archaeon]|nr:hypothetical protein [archaeon]